MASVAKLTRKLTSDFLQLCHTRRLIQLSCSSRRYSTKQTTIQEARDRLKELVGAQLKWGQNQDNVVTESNIITSQSDLPIRKMSDSYCESIIPLGQNDILREKYINFYGGMRFGRILEDLDTFAVLISYTHSTQGSEKKSPVSIVTALVDRIEIGNQRISPFKDIKMKGNVTWAGNTSMEVTMNLEQQEGSEWQHVLKARFVMVARNPVTKKSALINALQPSNPEEEKIFQLGEVNKIKRQEEAKRTLLKTPPDENERLIIHEHFLKTLDPSGGTFKIRVKPENSVWMEETKLKNLTICFPEQRNLYNKIFGGYLMRKAFELAWINAALYSKSRVLIKTVDDIVFKKPVEIGSLLFLSSEVVYTKEQMVQLHVHAEVLNPVEQTRATTNDFHFTFDSLKEDLPSVIPKTYAGILPDPVVNLEEGWLSESKGIEKWPPTVYHDISNFLTCSYQANKSLNDRLMKDYKEGKAYSYFSSGWLKEVFYHEINSSSTFCFLKAECTPSQRISDIPHRCWVCINKQNGEIHSAYCTCFAGLGETCNHVAALLFKVDYAWQWGVNRKTCTSKPCLWNAPSGKKMMVEPKRLSAMQIMKPHYSKGKFMLFLDGKRHFES